MIKERNILYFPLSTLPPASFFEAGGIRGKLRYMIPSSPENLRRITEWFPGESSTQQRYFREEKYGLKTVRLLEGWDLSRTIEKELILLLKRAKKDERLPRLQMLRLFYAHEKIHHVRKVFHDHNKKARQTKQSVTVPYLYSDIAEIEGRYRIHLPRMPFSSEYVGKRGYYVQPPLEFQPAENLTYIYYPDTIEEALLKHRTLPLKEKLRAVRREL